MIIIYPVFSLLQVVIHVIWCDPGILDSRPLNNFGKALELFGKLQCKEYQFLAIAKLDTFL